MISVHHCHFIPGRQDSNRSSERPHEFARSDTARYLGSDSGHERSPWSCLGLAGRVPLLRFARLDFAIIPSPVPVQTSDAVRGSHCSFRCCESYWRSGSSQLEKSAWATLCADPERSWRGSSSGSGCGCAGGDFQGGPASASGSPAWTPGCLGPGRRTGAGGELRGSVSPGSPGGEAGQSVHPGGQCGPRV